MAIVRKNGWIVALVSITAAGAGQSVAPLADPTDEPLLPSGISEFPLTVNGQLAYVFQDEDGTDALHVVGDCTLIHAALEGVGADGSGRWGIDGAGGQRLQAQEAAIWIHHRHHDGRPYRHIEILLWRDAQVLDIGGTLTSGPALFVTLNTTGDVHAHLDEIGYQSSAGSRVFREGNRIRKTIVDALPGDDPRVHLRVIDASGLAKAPEPKRPPPLVRLHTDGELKMSRAPDGQQVLVVTGGVYLVRGLRDAGSFLEIQADSVVVFLPTTPQKSDAGLKEAPGGLGGQPEDDLTGEGAEDSARRAEQEAGRPPDFERPSGAMRQRLSTGFGDVSVEAAYLEGDVVMAQGPNTVRASRVYYDFVQDRALILDAVVHTQIASRNLPLYLRAAEIRQLSTRQYSATDARLTTSEFYTPHYHIGAQRIDLTDLTPADPGGPSRGVSAGSFRVRHATLNIGGRPIAYWPFARGRVDTGETSLRAARSGYSDELGLELETDWNLFNVLGYETPAGVDARLSLDYYSERGPAAGVDATYKRDTYFGLIRSNMLTDQGEDFLGRDRERPSEQDMRGRFLMRHRHYLEDDWQVSLEISFISDSGFLEEFFESEFDNDKEQETLLHFKKQQSNWAVTALMQSRILDFETQTEHLPEVAYYRVGEPIGEHIVWHTEARGGIVRLRQGDQTFQEILRGGLRRSSDSTARLDSRHEFEAPMDAGPIRLVPFASIRNSTWSDSPEDGSVRRTFGTLGVRSSMYLWKVYPEARSELFDIDGLRHIIKPELTAWTASTNRDAHELYVFDETVEQIDEVDGVNVGLRQRWQTKRGAPNARRNVDVITWDLEAGGFNDAPGRAVSNGFGSVSRPENSIARNHAASSIIWRVNDRTALLSEMNYDMSDRKIDVLNVSVSVERSPRMSYLIGYRLIDKSDSNLLGFDLNYRMTEKHTLALRELFDLERGRTLDFTVALIRRFPRWFAALSFALDEPEDDFGVSMSIWPEGLPNATLGSRRFTGLSSGTDLRSR